MRFLVPQPFAKGTGAVGFIRRLKINLQLDVNQIKQRVVAEKEKVVDKALVSNQVRGRSQGNAILPSYPLVASYVAAVQLQLRRFSRRNDTPPSQERPHTSPLYLTTTLEMARERQYKSQLDTHRQVIQEPEQQRLGSGCY
jgi:hypothetical protein